MSDTHSSSHQSTAPRDGDDVLERLAHAWSETCPAPRPEARARTLEAVLARVAAVEDPGQQLAGEECAPSRQATAAQRRHVEAAPPDGARGINATLQAGVRTMTRIASRAGGGGTRRLRPALIGATAMATVAVAAVMVVPLGPVGPDGEVAMTDESGSMDTISEMTPAPSSPPASQQQGPAPKSAARPTPQGGAATQENMAAPLSRAAPETLMQAAPAADSMRAPPALPPDVVPAPPGDRDRFAEADVNPVTSVAEEPVSTFSIDVDTASYSTVRRYLQGGRVPPSDAVRLEEMVNYFSYDWPAPTAGDPHPFRADAVNYATPWNENTEVVRIGIQGLEPAIDDRPPLDLVFLVDTSGSMRSPDKLGLLRQALSMMLPELRAEDRVAIVTYAGSAGVALEPTSAAEAETIRAALGRLSAGGSTAGAAGLRTAYDLAGQSADDDRISRVILATDGDFNVGMSSVEDMKRFIETKRATGTYLSVLGFGQGNYNDALMQALAQNGNGQAAYIDTLSEARKVLVDQLAGTLFPIAQDVKIQVEFNPETVAEYRLLGYETRALRREDFANDAVDAGEIGAGHQVTALYEITPADSPIRRLEPLRYGTSDPAPAADGEFSDELGFLRLRYKDPGADTSTLIETPIDAEIEQPTVDDRFAAAVAAFAQDLRGGRAAGELGDWTMADTLDLARSGRGEDPFGYRAGAIDLMAIYEALPR